MITPEPQNASRSTSNRRPSRRTSRCIEPELVQIPEEYFWMGSDEEDKESWDAEKPRHRLYLPEYWIGCYPVTVAEFAMFVQDAGYQTTAEKKSSEYNWMQPKGKESHIRSKQDHPVTNVSWNDAIAYCRWLSQVTGKRYTLPSEAEWEKAARGIDGRMYPWGNRWEENRCNTIESRIRDTTPVGYFSPQGGDSPYGCADMAGNVWEWTRSRKQKYPYELHDGREDMRGEASRVQRGSSWRDYGRYARCAYRFISLPFYWNDCFGFRVVVFL